MRKVYGAIFCDRCGAKIKDMVEFTFRDVTDTRFVPLVLCEECEALIDAKNKENKNE